MAAKYRTQILLEPEQYKALTELAQRQGGSLSRLVREAVAEYLVGQDRVRERERVLRTLEELAELRQELYEQHGFFPDNLLEEAREERLEEIERVWRGEE